MSKSIVILVRIALRVLGAGRQTISRYWKKSSHDLSATGKSDAAGLLPSHQSHPLAPAGSFADTALTANSDSDDPANSLPQVTPEMVAFFRSHRDNN